MADRDAFDEETFGAVNQVVAQNGGPGTRKAGAKGKIVVESKQPSGEQASFKTLKEAEKE